MEVGLFDRRTKKQVFHEQHFRMDIEDFYFNFYLMLGETPLLKDMVHPDFLEDGFKLVDFPQLTNLMHLCQACEGDLRVGWTVDPQDFALICGFEGVSDHVYESPMSSLERGFKDVNFKSIPETQHFLIELSFLKEKVWPWEYDAGMDSWQGSSRNDFLTWKSFTDVCKAFDISLTNDTLIGWENHIVLRAHLRNWDFHDVEALVGLFEGNVTSKVTDDTFKNFEIVCRYYRSN